MVLDILMILEKGIWFGFAALGFAVLFNVPQRALMIIWLIGAAGGLTKLIMMQCNIGIVIATFAGASLVGILSVSAAHNKHAPPLVFSIPSVIPMIPGAFAYRMMLGLMKLSGTAISNDNYYQTLAETTSNGLKALFILLALAVGVAIPMLISRKETIKKIRHKSDSLE
ncbi:MAG: threonine/serine exporter family protein [Bacteroidia bacterium]|nr:threonine/serine exporter family protein [Bacteroidia bacterium]